MTENQYEMTEGTKPDRSEPHEARVVRRTDPQGEVYMMTEIGDGIFVQWGNCAKCRSRVDSCSCAGGPEAPHYIATWRDQRFSKEVLRRMPAPGRKELEDEFTYYDAALLALDWIDAHFSGQIPFTGPGRRAAAESLALTLESQRVRPLTQDEEASPEVPAEAPPSDTRQRVDDGLDNALEQVRAASNEQSEEDPNDVGF